MLLLDNGTLRVPFERLRLTGSQLVVRFACTLDMRYTLIRRLYGGDYRTEVEHVRASQVLRTLLRRLVG